MAHRVKIRYVLDCQECGYSVTKEQLPISRCPKCGSYAFAPIPNPGPAMTYTEVVDQYRHEHPHEPMSRALACRIEVGFIDKLINSIVADGKASALGITVHSDLFDPLPRIRRYDCFGQLRLF